MKNWKLPPLSRGGKTIRNLLSALVLLVFLWGLNGFPIPILYLNFRRAETENLIGRSDIQGSFQDTGKNWWTVGVQQDQVLLLRHNLYSGRSIQPWPRSEDSPTLVPVPRYIPFPEEVQVIAADVPEGTASARLELTLGCWHGDEDLSSYQYITAWREDFGPEDGEAFWWERTYHAEGELLRGGAALFRVVCPDEHTDPSVNVGTVERMAFEQLGWWWTFTKHAKYRSIDCHMEAVFYDETGLELDRASLRALEGSEMFDP